MHANMDGCHARSQCSADTTGHGKTCFHGEKKGSSGMFIHRKKRLTGMHGLYRNLPIHSMRCPAGRNS